MAMYKGRYKGKAEFTTDRRNKILKRHLKEDVVTSFTAVPYIAALVGNTIAESDNKINTFLDVSTYFKMFSHPWAIYPTSMPLVTASLFVSAFLAAKAYDHYVRQKNIEINAYGKAGFETDYDTFYRKYLYSPKIMYGNGGENNGGENSDEKNHIIAKIAEHFINGKNNNVTFVDGKKFWAGPVTKEQEKACMDYSQIYSKHIYMSLDAKYTNRNLNVLVFGASGTGKSFYYLRPNVLQANSSYIITDPSGELIRDMGHFLEMQGYVIKVLNINDLSMSNRYNPLMYLTKESDIAPLVVCLKNNISGTNKSGGGDAVFWDQSAITLLTSMIAYQYEVYSDENEFIVDSNGNQVINPSWIGHRSLPNVMTMLSAGSGDEAVALDKNSSQEDIAAAANDLDKLFADWESEHPESFAVAEYRTFKQAGQGKTAANILVTTSMMLASSFYSSDIVNLTYRDEMELENVGNKKTAIFVVTSSNDSPYNFLAAMFYTQLFDLLYKQGEHNADLRHNDDVSLNIPVRFFLDEFANIGSVPGFDKKLSTMRKYGVSAVPIYQSLAQLKQMYKDVWETIIGNCDAMIFLGGTEPSEVKMVMERIGKGTVTVKTTSEGKGKNKSQNESKQQTGMYLMTEEEIGRMEGDKCLIFLRGERPFFDYKYNVMTHENYKYTSNANADVNSYDISTKYHIKYNGRDVQSLKLFLPSDYRYRLPKYNGDHYDEYTPKILTKSSLYFNTYKTLPKWAIEAEKEYRQKNYEEKQKQNNQEFENLPQEKKEEIAKKIEEVSKKINVDGTKFLDGETVETMTEKLDLMMSYSPEYEFGDDDFEIENDNKPEESEIEESDKTEIEESESSDESDENKTEESESSDKSDENKSEESEADESDDNKTEESETEESETSDESDDNKTEESETEMDTLENNKNNYDFFS